MWSSRVLVCHLFLYVYEVNRNGSRLLLARRRCDLVVPSTRAQSDGMHCHDLLRYQDLLILIYVLDDMLMFADQNFGGPFHYILFLDFLLMTFYSS